MAETKHRIAEIARKTVDTVRDVVMELPAVRSAEEAAVVLLGGDRKLYVGIALLALALLTLVLASD